ncbi:MAG TPA: serine hydrolase domain-containing protein, partial [Qipengyuania sp.]|nr:serine hydrolase domain-containing protein [Qipengyuania sp.]
MRFTSFASFIAIAIASAAPVSAQTTAAPAAAATAEQSPIDAAGGTATLIVPPGWTHSTKGAATVLTAPEGDVTIALLPVTGAADGDAAVAQAWKAFQPAFARPIRLAQDAPGRDGWDASRVVNYDIAPAEKHVAQGVALKKGDSYTVVLIDGALATVAKRGGQLGQAFGSLRPKGFAKESFAGKTAHPLDATRVKQLVDFTRESMAALKIPGVGLVLIDDGRIVWEGGLGVKDTATGAAVDKDTLFMIASNTKGMATLLLSTLVDEGKLDWNKPVTDYMPSFRLGSAETTRKVLVKHLVCACTGLPRKDMQWLFNTNPQTPASDTFVQLAATEPTSGFGEVFQYNNLMASAAGYLGAHIIYPGMELGAAYDKAMDERLFTPLGMTRTTHSAAEAMAGNWAKPYDVGIRGDVQPVDPRNNDTVVPYRPAGGAWSSAHDMALYVQNELAEGMLPSGKRLVSAEALLARRAHNVPTGENQWYGMGLFEDASKGVTVVQHGGSMFGYKSNWFAIPSAGVGAVVLTNSDTGYALTEAVKRRLLEVLYDGKPEAAENIATGAKRSAEGRAKLLSELTWPIAPAQEATVVGTYSNAE